MNYCSTLLALALAAVGLVVAACSLAESNIGVRTAVAGEKRLRYDATKPRGKRWGF